MLSSTQATHTNYVFKYCSCVFTDVYKMFTGESCHAICRHVLQLIKKHRGRKVCMGVCSCFLIKSISHSQNSTYTYLICREFILSACQNDYITMVASSFKYLILHTLHYNTCKIFGTCSVNLMPFSYSVC